MLISPSLDLILFLSRFETRKTEIAFNIKLLHVKIDLGNYKKDEIHGLFKFCVFLFSSFWVLYSLKS